ncbi:MAG TPA: SDR family oxidoreductase [Ornithinimicrobium sp.]|uniref:SDR family oxidoreductase n=1 Tax=Ornithinimicrobium sp. TaxID=1977084 RepID=UPI002B47F452|nr:SDR family oxidoreductase [Ornithinimicrobium sp.]HKJ11425.1 SDR family oxidoreductase [Ornithinimicrobium sp.]
MTETNLRVAVVGGHGKIALQLTRLLTERGDAVTALIRNPDHESEVRSAGATPEMADVEAMSAEEVAELFTGHQAVVFAAGAGGGDPDRTYAVDRDAAIACADAARTSGASRFVLLSYFGAGPDHGVPSDSSFFPYAEAKAAADEYLRGSPGLSWTIVGPSALTDDEGTGTIDTSAQEAGQVSRADVAATIAAVLRDDRTSGRTICFNDGDTPIAEAIARAAENGTASADG